MPFRGGPSTTTKVATVNAALEYVVKRHKHASFLDWPAESGLPDLTEPVESSEGRPGGHRRLTHTGTPCPASHRRCMA